MVSMLVMLVSQIVELLQTSTSELVAALLPVSQRSPRNKHYLLVTAATLAEITLAIALLCTSKAHVVSP